MGTLEEVKQLKSQGLSQEQIIKTLRDKKVAYKDISNALAQSDIKAAIEEPAQPNMPPAPQAPPAVQAAVPQQPQFDQISTQAAPPSDAAPLQFSENSSGQMPQQMQASPPLDNQPQAPPMDQTAPPAPAPQAPAPEMLPPIPSDAPAAPSPSDSFPPPPTQEPSQLQGGFPPQQEYGQEDYGGYDQQDQGYEDYGGYGYSQGGGMSSDTISEVAEQVVAQKISDIRKPLEKVIDFKTNIETQIEGVEERLARIEKIIHTLQSSVIGKVGEFMTNVSDIKKEMIETQKTFAKVASKRKTTTRKKTSKKK